MINALQLPCTLFRTQKRIDDYSAGDMRCGELTETQLRTYYGLEYISDQADPWTLTRRSSMDRPQSMFCCNLRDPGKKITRQQCAAILFDEFRFLSRQFSFCGPYRHLIEKMITHMQTGNGTPFRDVLLDRALKEQILNDITDKSTFFRIKEVIKNYINWEKNTFPIEKKTNFVKQYLVVNYLNLTDFRIILMAWVLRFMTPGQQTSP
ncbi:hypothetical protein GTPT_0600 [Tatumella ptyseos ATCC 33301]|uniref:DUF3289 family protein n=1 Tax=Tatumella ptyseos ATCC 33301 TaxID=1005995 RepID=A0A085JN42_9GAMM|nr:hypothetical protein GTPT_0600 [Tatumella ptyseos ATCC 33301]